MCRGVTTRASSLFDTQSGRCPEYLQARLRASGNTQTGNDSDLVRRSALVRKRSRDDAPIAPHGADVVDLQRTLLRHALEPW
jgi:hypothetical protein